MVACRQLGFNSITFTTETLGYWTPTNTSYAANPMWLDHARCMGTEERIEDCAHFGFGQSRCHYLGSIGLAAVDCYTLPLARMRLSERKFKEKDMGKTCSKVHSPASNATGAWHPEASTRCTETSLAVSAWLVIGRLRREVKQLHEQTKNQKPRQSK